MIDLLHGKYRSRAISELLRRHAREIEALRRAGFSGDPDPIEDDDQGGSGDLDILRGPNQIAVTDTAGVTFALEMPPNSAVIRRDGNITTSAAPNRGVMYRTEGGTLGFLGIGAFADDAAIVTSERMPSVTQAIGGSGSVTMDPDVAVYIPNFSANGDFNFVLPALTPGTVGWVYVVDPLGSASGSRRYRLTASGSNTVNGVAATSYINFAHGGFFALGAIGSVDRWTARQI